MLKINFYPESDNFEAIAGAKDYQAIWDEEGPKIQRVMEDVSQLKFVERIMNALVFGGTLPSRSYPLQFNFNHDPLLKKGVMIHELCHRLLSIKVHEKEPRKSSLLIHQCVYLILYDILEALYGRDFADQFVAYESTKLSDIYREAWDWVLSLDKDRRTRKFAELVIKKNVTALDLA